MARYLIENQGGGESAGFVTVEELAQIDFHTFFAPSPSTPLHVRIVHQAHIENPHREDTPFQSRVKLAKLLNRPAA